MNTKSVRILLADDNPALRSALALLLETRLHARIVGEVYRMEDLLAGVNHLLPDILILDWELPGLPQTDRIAALRQASPSLKIVITSSRPEASEKVLAAHADAYISKSEPPEEMVRVLRTVKPYLLGRKKDEATASRVRT